MPSATFEEAGFREWWEVLPPGPHTITGTLKEHPAFASARLGNRRRVWLWLPPSYFHTDARYPVLYLNDGQSLWCRCCTWNGQEWRVDETMQRLAGEGIEAIVVGVEIVDGRRGDEYCPWYQGGRFNATGARYVCYLAEELKPFIDQVCRTLPDRDHTGIMGSSLGAVSALYAFCEAPQTFGLCGAMSPCTGIEEFMAYVQQAPYRPGRLYTDHGSNEAGFDSWPLYVALRAKGYRPGLELLQAMECGAGHNEEAWARRFPTAVRFLLERIPADAEAPFRHVRPPRFLHRVALPVSGPAEFQRDVHSALEQLRTCLPRRYRQVLEYLPQAAFVEHLASSRFAEGVPANAAGYFTGAYRAGRDPLRTLLEYLIHECGHNLDAADDGYAAQEWRAQQFAWLVLTELDQAQAGPLFATPSAREAPVAEAAPGVPPDALVLSPAEWRRMGAGRREPE